MDITEKAFETHIVDHLCQVHGYRLRISKQQNNAKDSHYSNPKSVVGISVAETLCVVWAPGGGPPPPPEVGGLKF